MADATPDTNPVTADQAEATPEVIPDHIDEAAEVIPLHADEAAEVIEAHTPDRNPVIAPHTEAVAAWTDAHPAEMTEEILSQFSAIRTPRATTAATIHAIGPRPITHAAAIRSPAAVACTPISTHPAATFAAFATAAAPMITHPATT